MILRSLTSLAPLGITFLLSLLTFSSLTSAKKEQPRISTTSFESPLQNLFYFDGSEVVIAHDRELANVWRSDDGGESWKIIEGDGQKNAAWDVWPHLYDKKKAYILGLEHKHWKTDDRGETWTSFETQATPSLFRQPFAFHGRDFDKIIFHGQLCEGWVCSEKAFYTEDDFDNIHLLRDDARGCLWATGSPEVAQEVDSIIEDRVYCIVRGSFSPWPADNKFVSSDNYFIEEKEVVMSSGRTVKGFINAETIKGYIVAAAKSQGTDELALFTTHDASTWHLAEFGNHKVEQEAYTILESTNYSLQVDVLTTKPSSAMGVLFTSNSNGTYFTRNIEHTNRDLSGMVDFEKVAGIQGIVLVNTVDNWEEVEETNLQDKRVQSSISFDDGRTFQKLKVGDKRLHLHSVSDLSNSGRVFSSPAPGLVMGIGNTGDHLKDYEEGNLYVSDDAGVTWRKGLDGAHKYEFGDQGAVLIAVADKGTTNKVQYSINHGKDWDAVTLDEKITLKLLTTVPSSTGLKFLIEATSGSDDSFEWRMISVDFDGLHERKCGKDDFERWAARVDEDGEPSCIMGHKQFYRRRKANKDCFVDEEFKNPTPELEQCECTKADFECDYNFVASDNREECVSAIEHKVPVPEGECRGPKDKYMGSSGWRLIPGNDCKRTKGKQLDDETERSCDEASTKPTTGKVATEKTIFKAGSFAEYYYLERTESSRGEDETVIMRTSEGGIFHTIDHGKTWKRILEDENIRAIYPHPYFSDRVFFLTDTKKVIYSIDRGTTMHSFDVPDKADQRGLPPLSFHPEYKDWLIWIGQSECPGSDCHSVAHYTTDRGDNWNTLLRYVRKCDFIKDPEQGQDPNHNNKQLVYCEQYENENPDNALQLLSSTNWFADKKVHFTDILDYAVMSEFIIVAARAKDQSTLKVDASIDADTFADAEFPPNFQVDHQSAYTVLDSSTHAVFLHVTVNNQQDHEHGTIIKSNSNGTSYVLSLSGVNRDSEGYVDFEKMQGLEGVALVNVVSNADKSDKGENKKLKTMISHNDGADWALITPPSTNPEGKKFKCSSKNGKASDKCALHLHSYTERENKQATFGSNSAIGLMMAVGNVGESLQPRSDDETYTFLTNDGGITWRAAKQGSYMWEYGDQGSVIVIVKESSPTKLVHYSLDEGATWLDVEFSEKDMEIDSISTLPSDNSFNFLLWGREKGTTKEAVAVNLDFSGLEERERKCDFDEANTNNDDYYLWSPKHPLLNDDCLFGHVAQYHRKRPEAQCYNGPVIEKLHDYARNCSCTRVDFECDYNYERYQDGSCYLVPGLAEPDHSAICREDPDAVEFYKPTGYRRIPLTTCEGGTEFDKDTSQPCDGHEQQWKRKHGVSGIGLFFAIIIPIAVAVGVGYYVYREYKTGRLAGFGQIRLGEPSESLGSRESPFITIPVNVIAGTWAVAKATPLLGMSLWRSLRGYFPIAGGGSAARQPSYRSRAAFSRRGPQGDYEGVVADEDELLGDDFDEDAE